MTLHLAMELEHAVLVSLTRNLAQNLVRDLAWGSLHILIHEGGHILAAFMVGSRIKQLGFSKAGAFVRREPARTRFRNVMVALAGPGANLLTWGLFKVYGLPSAWIPLTLGLVNLLPFPKSDFMKTISYMRAGEQKC